MSLIFSNPLITTLVPAVAAGSPTPTFTRASTATLIDFEGIVRYAIDSEARFYGARRVFNCVGGSSQNLAGAGWGTTGAVGSVTANAGVAPDGTTTATRIVFTGGAAQVSGVTSKFDQSVLASSSLRVSAVSGWVRASSGTSTFRIKNTQSAVVDNFSPDLTATTTWQRFAYVLTFTASAGNGEANVGIIADVGGSAADLLVWGMQCENVTGQSNTAPGNYVSVGVLSSPYHGANVDGVKYFTTVNGNSVNANVVTEATGTAIADATLVGYLPEAGRTNVALRSEEFDNAAWVKVNTTVSANSTASPDGTTTADTLTATLANATTLQTIVEASAVKVFTIWLKRSVGTGNVQLTLDGGVGWTTVAVTAAWTRFKIFQTLANQVIGVRLVTNGDAVFAWGAQCETDVQFSNGALSSYVPALAAGVSRAADALTYARVGNISNAAGTCYARVATSFNFGPENARVIGDTASSATPLFYTNKAVNASCGMYDESSLATVTYTASLADNLSSTWITAGNMVPYANASVGVGGPYDGSWLTGLIYVGAGDAFAFVPIRNIKIWDTVLPIGPNGIPIEGDTVVITSDVVLEDGPKWYVKMISGYITPGTQTPLVIIDPMNFNPNGSNPMPSFALDSVVWSMQHSMTGRLLWEATVNVDAFDMVNTKASRFRSPILNNAGVGKTNRLLLDGFRTDTSDGANKYFSFQIRVLKMGA